ncbi:hypothetical protein GCM10009525_48230 [Streptosporangium amethystogenes subsp. fukuiense]
MSQDQAWSHRKEVVKGFPAGPAASPVPVRQGDTEYSDNARDETALGGNQSVSMATTIDTKATTRIRIP